jgi:dipeptidyl aminopeptidase/acylaminoacyl peptidase
MNASKRTLPIALFLVFSAALIPGTAHGADELNGKIAFESSADGDFDIYVMNADGTDVQNLTTANDGDGPWNEYDPAWSPDGSKIAFTSDRGGIITNQIWAINADGSNLVHLTAGQESSSNWGAAWSPDGSKIAFTSTRDGDWEVFTMNADGSEQTNITGPNQTLAYDDMNPDWSPDGTRIVFQGVREGAWEILTMAPDGTGEVNLTWEDDPPWLNINWSPTYRPDGSKILYMSQPNDGSNDWDIWVMNPDGTQKQNVLPDDEWQDVGPAWSPDGTKITFSGNRSAFGDDIFVMEYVEPSTASTFSAAGRPGPGPGPAPGITQLTTNGSSTNPDWVASGGAPPPPPPPPNVDVTVTSSDAGFSPKAVSIAQGDTVGWAFAGPGTHSVQDASGMTLFGSAAKQPGGSYVFSFVGAGTYAYKDGSNGALKGQVRVPVVVTPSSGSAATSFLVRWTSGPPPAGFAFDVQIKRLAAAWTAWRTATTSVSGTFVADAGPGTYRFRARIRNLANGRASGFSPAIVVKVV